MQETMTIHSSDAPFQKNLRKQIYFAFAVGMAINIGSIYVGNQYLISLLMLPVALLSTLKWLHKPLPWIVLVSVIAANPLNLYASISLNLIFALIYLICIYPVTISFPAGFMSCSYLPLFPLWAA